MNANECKKRPTKKQPRRKGFYLNHRTETYRPIRSKMMNGQFQTAGQHSRVPTLMELLTTPITDSSLRASSDFQQNGQNTASYSKTSGYSYQTPSINRRSVVHYSRAQTSSNVSVHPRLPAYKRQHVTFSNQPAVQHQMSRHHKRAFSDPNQQNQWVSNQNVNSMVAKPLPPYMPTATSLPQGQMVYTGHVVANSHQVGNNQIYRHPAYPTMSHSVAPSYLVQAQREASSNLTSNSYGRPLVPTDRVMTTNSQPPTSTVDTSKFRPSNFVEEPMTFREILADLYNSYPGDNPPVNPQSQCMNRAAPPSVTTTLDVRGNATQNNIFSQGYRVQSTEGASQPVILNSNISTQGTQALASAVNNQNEKPLNSFSACSASRAVAVVQPLSQESCQVVHNSPSPETLKPQDECTATDGSCLNLRKKSITPPFDNIVDNLGTCNTQLQDTNQNSLHVQKEIAPSDDTVVSAMKSAGPPDSQIQLASVADDRQNSATETSDLATACKASATDLSSAQTRLWTYGNLKDSIEKFEKEQKTLQEQKNDSSTSSSTTQKISSLYDVKTISSQMKLGFFNRLSLLMRGIDESLTARSLILTELPQSQMNQIQNVHVLQDGEVYREPPYTSSWLNINEMLDDIDKEFGYPYSLRRRFLVKENDTQLDVMDGTNSSEDVDKELWDQLDVIDGTNSSEDLYKELLDQLDVKDGTNRSEDIDKELLDVKDGTNRSEDIDKELLDVKDGTNRSEDIDKELLDVMDWTNSSKDIDRELLDVMDGTNSSKDIDRELLDVMDGTNSSKDIDRELLDVMDGTNSSEDFDKEIQETPPIHIDVVEGNQGSDVTTTSTASPCAEDTDAVELSDPYYSFEIKVLSPDEAKSIAELVHGKAPNTTEGQEETVKKAPAEEKKSDTDVQEETCNDDIVAVTKVEQKTVSEVQEICCITGWYELFCGTNVKTCKCKIKQCCTRPAEEICVHKTHDENKHDEDSFPDSHKETKTCSSGNKEDNQPSVADVTKTADDTSDCLSDFQQISNLCIDEEFVPEQQESVKKDDSEISSTSSEEPESTASSDLGGVEKNEEPHCPKDIPEPAHRERITSDLKLTVSLKEQRPKIKRKAPRSDEMSPLAKKSRISRDSRSVIPRVGCKDDSTKKVSSGELILRLYGTPKGKLFCNTVTHQPPEVLCVNVRSPKTEVFSVSPAKYSAKEKVLENWKKAFTPLKFKHKRQPAFIPQDRCVTRRGKKADRRSKPLMLQLLSENPKLHKSKKKRGGY